ncbi:MAG TPA: hypothetical protein VFA63_15815 [Pseudonocardiaceae bacterium]|nr:hypothetical protein [Pseudonocardiaceae bacterium]
MSRIGSRVLACLTAITLLAPVQALVASPASAVAPTPGNIIVSRLGDGSSSLGSAATPVFLDEYKPDGTFVQTTALPTAVAGTQRRLTMSGSASSEGALSSGRWQARYPDRTANFGPHRRPSSARPMHRSGWPTSGQRSTETSGLTRVQGGLLSEIKEPVIRQWRKKLQDAGVGAATLAEAYRLVHSIFNTAVDDLLIRRNPCRIKAAGQDKAHQRFALTIDQVFAVADAIQLRYRLLVLLGALTSLRFGEFAALRRRDVNPDGGELRVRRSQAELQHGRTIIKDPKSEAGKRSVAIPEVVLPDLRDHLARFSETGPDGLVFVGPKGGRLGRRNFLRLWRKALATPTSRKMCTSTTCATPVMPLRQPPEQAPRNSWRGWATRRSEPH